MRDQDVFSKLASSGVTSIVEEFDAHGTESDRECLRYVLEMLAGSSPKRFQDGLMRDCNADGQLLCSREIKLPNDAKRPMLFEDFCTHPNSIQAGLGRMHVLALRLYTTAAFRSFNDPLRDAQRTEPHGFPATINCIAEGIRRLRAVSATRDDAHQEVELWRGLADTTLPETFLKFGGTELAPMVRCPAHPPTPPPPDGRTL